MSDLFCLQGAEFSACRKYRYALWRIWDETLPLVMFIGLNPSTANEGEDDATIESVTRISTHNGYGGFYMMNSFPYIATDPKELTVFGNTIENDMWLRSIAAKCADIIFAYGNFKVMKDRSIELKGMFPKRKALQINKNGSPRHPLYMKGTTKPVDY